MVTPTSTRCLRAGTLTARRPVATVSPMGQLVEPSRRTRRCRRTAYERLIALGAFAGERLELLDGGLVVREPPGSAHAALVAHVAGLLP